MTILAILTSICSAGLAAATERIATRLLILAGEAQQINLTWEAYLDLAGINNVNAARRHLSRLARAGIIHYSTNDYIYVTFLATLRAAESAPTRPDERADAPPAARTVTEPVTAAPTPARRRAGRGAWARNSPPHPQYRSTKIHDGKDYIPEHYRQHIIGA